MSEHHHYDHRDAACEDCMAREARIAELEAAIRKAVEAYPESCDEEGTVMEALRAALEKP